MSLETLNNTIGNIIMDLKIVSTNLAVFSKHRVFRGHEHNLMFVNWNLVNSDVRLKYLTKY
jgi:hypothetical protein